MSPVIMDSSIFDSKPLDKKNLKERNERDLKYFLLIKRQKIQKAIQQCLSSYILTSFKKQIQHDFENKEDMSDKKANKKLLWKDSDELKKYCVKINDKTNLIIKQVTYHVESNINSLASSVLDVFKSKFKKEQISSKKQIKHQQKRQLSQSNRNFLIQLLTQLGFLKNYRQMDRTFIRLVTEAQKSYFNIKKIQESIKISKENSFQNHEEPIFQDLKKISKYFQVSSTFNQTKKRFNNLVQSQQFKIKYPSESDEKVIGYSLKQSDQSICENTQNNNRYQNESRQFSKGLYFADHNQENCLEIKQSQDRMINLHSELFTKIQNKYGNFH